jgi:uncharacterized protein (DUF924 family)
MYQKILTFWFEEIQPTQWWSKDSQFDNIIIDRFSAIHTKATQCELYNWRKTPEGRLAEIIILDQFSRNIFRDTPLSFTNDSLALSLSQEAIHVGADKDVSEHKRPFFYLPYMHSESKAIHEVAIDLYTSLGDEDNLAFEWKHKTIIDRFGRYPHRNNILGRVSSIEEEVFLAGPESSF